MLVVYIRKGYYEREAINNNYLQLFLLPLPWPPADPVGARNYAPHSLGFIRENAKRSP
jgi:hypothetical protein